jgi:hypothetical protein
MVMVYWTPLSGVPVSWMSSRRLHGLVPFLSENGIVEGIIFVNFMSEFVTFSNRTQNST